MEYKISTVWSVTDLLAQVESATTIPRKIFDIAQASVIQMIKDTNFKGFQNLMNYNRNEKN